MVKESIGFNYKKYKNAVDSEAKKCFKAYTGRSQVTSESFEELDMFTAGFARGVSHVNDQNENAELQIDKLKQSYYDLQHLYEQLSCHAAQQKEEIWKHEQEWKALDKLNDKEFAEKAKKNAKVSPVEGK